MKGINLVLIIVIVIVIAMIIGTIKTTGNSINNKDEFEGIITNLELPIGKLEGIGVYDKSCNPVENKLTQCDAGIQTEKGLLNFNYKHYMHSQPCISEGDKLVVEIFEGGKAKVTRT